MKSLRRAVFNVLGPVALAVFSCKTFAQTPATSGASPSIPSNQGYALFSPQMAERLKGLTDTKRARKIIKSATKALSDEPHPVNPQGKQKSTQEYWNQGPKVCEKENSNMRDDSHNMLDFALAYRMTGDPKYLQAEEKYLKAWLRGYRFSYYPLSEYDLELWAVSYDLTGKDLSAETREKFLHFLKEMAEGYLAAFAQYGTAACNGRSICLELATMASYATGNEALINRCRTAFKQYKTVDIHPDGSLQDFYTRDALYYVDYDLGWLLKTCIAAKAHGEDWFRPEVARAVDWLKLYALGQKTHRDFVLSNVPADDQRAKAGFESFQGRYNPNVLWDPKHSTHNFLLASILEPSYRPVLEQICKNTGSKEPDPWEVLLSETGLSAKN